MSETFQPGPVGCDQPGNRSTPGGRGISTIGLVQSDEKGRLRCPRCGAGPRAGRETFRPLRLGMPFYLNISAPTLLDNTPGLAFEFAAAPARQARTLNRMAFEVKARHPAHPTIVYVTALRGPS